jgi:hypothetical protein
LTWLKGSSYDPGTLPALGGVESVMEAFLCPTCSQALKISTIEPHPTRDGVDVVTYRCLIHGDIWANVVVNKVKAADTQIAALAT